VWAPMALKPHCFSAILSLCCQAARPFPLHLSPTSDYFTHVAVLERQSLAAQGVEVNASHCAVAELPFCAFVEGTVTFN
jgi:hypothetical protein